MTPDPVRAIADAVLYEGYILWPYRHSALKNQRRFTFGGVYPPTHSERHPDDRAAMRTEVLVRGPQEARIRIAVRFLHVVERQVLDAKGRPVEELTVGGERFVSWEEAVEREIEADANLVRLRDAVAMPIMIAGGAEQEPLPASAGALRRSWHELRGVLTARSLELAEHVWRLSVDVANTTPFEGDRQAALRQAFCSTHAMLHAAGGEFVSLADPPAALAELAGQCENIGTWPVPVGEPGDRSTILSSPIILEDYPRIAPESPGDLFDGGEIDQLLTLSIMAMTDDEKAEMAASDPRAREILERTEALTPEQLMALHGVVREFGMARTP